MNIRSFVAPGFAENAYLVWQPNSTQALAIDPGDAPAIIQMLAAEKLQLAAILLTHSHVDHIDGVAELVRATNAPVYLHPEARLFYDNAGVQAAQFGMRVETPPPPTHELQPGQLALAGSQFDVPYGPGHAPGHVRLRRAGAGGAFDGG